MKNLVFAFLLVVGAAVVVFALLSSVGVASELAGSVASSLMAGITYVHQLLDKSEKTAGLLVVPKSLVPIDAFLMSSPVVATYVVAILFAVAQVSGGLSGLLLGLAGVRGDQATMAGSAIIGLTVVLPALYVLSKWIGRRARRRPLLTAILAAMLARVVVAAFDLLVIVVYGIGGNVLQVVGGPWGFFQQQMLGGGVLWVPVAALGGWFGIRSRRSAYLSFLLRKLPNETGDVLVALAYDESRRLAQAPKA